MMMPLRMKITYSGPIALFIKDSGQRTFNAMLAESLKEAGKLAVGFLDRHFTKGAVQAYGYSARGRAYLEAKRRKKYWKIKGKSYPVKKPPRPLVLVGDLEKAIKGRTPASYRIRATATRTRHKLKIPVRLPHPLYARHAEELGRLKQAEVDDMNALTWRKLQGRMANYQGIVVQEIR